MLQDVDLWTKRSRKTNLLTNILLKQLIQYDKIYLYAKFLEQPSMNICAIVLKKSQEKLVMMLLSAAMTK